MDFNYPSNIVLENNCSITSIVCSTARQKVPVTADIYKNIEQLPPVWDLLLPAGHRLVSHCLQYVEQSNVKDLSYYYAVVKKDNRPVGLIYFQRLALTKEHYPDFSSQGAIAKRVYNYIATKEYGVLTAGHKFYTGFPWYWFDDTQITADEFFKAVNKTAASLLKSTNSHIIILKDVDERLNNYLQQRPNGFEHMGEDIFMQMPLNRGWQTFDDYLAALSKKYAARVRKMKEAIAPLTVEKLSVARIKELLPEIERLYMEVISHSSVKIGILNADYFLFMKKALGADFEIFAWFEGDRMVAFASTLVENGSCEVYYIGYGEDDNRKYSLYPNILLFGVEQAITNKKKMLKLGRTALEAKTIVGAKPLYINNYIKMKNHFLQVGLSFMLKSFLKERGTEWKKRNPFKK